MTGECFLGGSVIWLPNSSGRPPPPAASGSGGCILFTVIFIYSFILFSVSLGGIKILCWLFLALFGPGTGPLPNHYLTPKTLDFDPESSNFITNRQIFGISFFLEGGGINVFFEGAGGGGAPAHRWAQQIQTLAEMGFTDQARVVQALDATGGNVDDALNHLF